MFLYKAIKSVRICISFGQSKSKYSRKERESLQAVESLDGEVLAARWTRLKKTPWNRGSKERTESKKAGQAKTGEEEMDPQSCVYDFIKIEVLRKTRTRTRPRPTVSSTRHQPENTTV